MTATCREVGLPHRADGAANRYPEGVPDKVRGVLQHELQLIAKLAYAPTS